MAMPTDLVLIRHGESEGNVVVNASKKGDNSRYTDAFTTTPGHRWRLTDDGRAQAASIGEWVSSEFGSFDRMYASPYVRARETAALLGIDDAQWRLNRALRERDWGDIGSMPRSEFESRPEYAANAAMKANDPLYWVPPGGESIAQVAEDRVRNVLDTLHRECDGQRVVAATHGELMWAFRIVLERLDDETFVRLDADPAERIVNGEALHYTRRNPSRPGRFDPAAASVEPRLSWLRRARPVLDDGTWVVEVGPWRRLEFATWTNSELLAAVDAVPSLLE